MLKTANICYLAHDAKVGWKVLENSGLGWLAGAGWPRMDSLMIWGWWAIGQHGLAFSAHDLSRLSSWWSHGFKCRKRKQNSHASISQAFFNGLASYLLMFHKTKQARWPSPDQSSFIDLIFDGQRSNITLQRGMHTGIEKAIVGT